MKNFLKEYKEFINKGDVIIVAVGLVMALYFKAIVDQLIAAIITPPDVVSQLSLAIPMCLLYEAGIWAAQIFIRRTQAPDAPEADPPTAS